MQGDAAIPKVVEVATSIAALNKRDRAIQQRLGSLNAESARLSAEQSGIQLRRLELMRSFDGAAQA